MAAAQTRPKKWRIREAHPGLAVEVIAGGQPQIGRQRETHSFVPVDRSFQAKRHVSYSRGAAVAWIEKQVTLIPRKPVIRKAALNAALLVIRIEIVAPIGAVGSGSTGAGAAIDTDAVRPGCKYRFGIYDAIDGCRGTYVIADLHEGNVDGQIDLVR